MIWWPGTTAPQGWLVRNGQEVSRTTYNRLFKVIGTRYGIGNGSTTFNVPDDTYNTYITELEATSIASDIPDFSKAIQIQNNYTTQSAGWVLLHGRQDCGNAYFYVNGLSFSYMHDSGDGQSSSSVMFPVKKGDNVSVSNYKISYFIPMTQQSISTSTISVDRDSHNGMYLPIIKY